MEYDGIWWDITEILMMIAGWWWLEHDFYFPIHIGNVIIPIDSYFSEGSKHQPDQDFGPVRYDDLHWLTQFYSERIWVAGMG